MSKLKIYLITACLIVSATLPSYGQKTLSEYTIKSTLLEEINAASIPDIQAYQKAKFKNSRGKRFTGVQLLSNEHNRVYRLKGQDDLIKISQRLSEELINNWDKGILWYSYVFTPLELGYPRYEEQMDSKDFRAYIFFIKDYKLSNSNYILYQNKKTKLTLFINYISNSPDDVKIATMRKIINDLKIE